MSDGGLPSSELIVPKTRRVVIGGSIGMIIMLAFICLSCLLAVYDLFTLTALVPSTIWLLLVAFVLRGFVSVAGWKKVATDALGTLSGKEFARTTRTRDGQAIFQYGFRMFGRWFSYSTVMVKKIESIAWNTGQASHRAGKDVNDWHVVVWYDHDDVAKSQKALSYHSKKPDQDLFIIGMSGAREETAALGHSVLDLLRKAGAVFTPGENDCTYVRQLSAIAST